MIKFIHAADIHLDSPLRGLERYEGAPLEEIRGASRRAFERLVSLAIDEAVAFVLIAGDLYDGDWKDYNTGLFFTSQMGRLNAAGIKVFVVAGNHDAASQLTRSLRPPPNVHLFATRAPQTVTLDTLGIAIHGQGFATRAVSEDLASGFPLAIAGLFNIGLLHTSLDGRPGHENYAPCSLDALRSRGYDYWALGHVHKREIVCEAPWVVFPGNLQGRHARELGPKGCTVVSVVDGQVAELAHHALDVVRWLDEAVALDDAATVDDVLMRMDQRLDALQDAHPDQLLALRLRLGGASPVDAHLRAGHEQLEAELRGRCAHRGGAGVWLEKIVVDTRPAFDPADTLQREDALGGLLRAIHALELDDAQLVELGADFADLRNKLPLELRSGDEAFDPCNAATLHAALSDVKALLASRLLGDGGHR